MHQLLEVKKKVEEEVIWINDYSYIVTLECNRISQENLSEFMQILSNGFNDTCVSKAFPNFLTCDICLLTCNRWFSYSTIQVFLELLNKAVTNVKFMLFSMIQYISYDAPKELIKSWKDQVVASCCAIVNIRLSERVTTRIWVTTGFASISDFSQIFGCMLIPLDIQYLRIFFNVWKT